MCWRANAVRLGNGNFVGEANIVWPPSNLNILLNLKTFSRKRSTSCTGYDSSSFATRTTRSLRRSETIWLVKPGNCSSLNHLKSYGRPKENCNYMSNCVSSTLPRMLGSAFNHYAKTFRIYTGNSWRTRSKTGRRGRKPLQNAVYERSASIGQCWYS